VSQRPIAPRVEPLGERALLVTLGDRVDLLVNARARQLAAAFEARRETDPRFGRAVPAAASVLVPFNPLAIEPVEATMIVVGIVDQVDAGVVADVGGARPPIEIGVHYGGRDGPDLAAVAENHGVSAADIVELHSGSVWTALFLGFAPGFAYLGPLPPELATPRRASPRERVPAGSVAIGADQTAVYPFALPGGWQVIGRTEVSMWDLARSRPNLVEPGDRVRFVPIR
jgi:KipI family sensor histidine kinase inhibitor